MPPKRSFTEILIAQGILSADQVTEAKKLARSSNKKLPDAILTLGYASGDEIMRAVAEEHGLDFIDLHEVAIPPSVVELVPGIGRPRERHPADGRTGRRGVAGHRQRSRTIWTRSTSFGSF